jgi:hypothetical protein
MQGKAVLVSGGTIRTRRRMPLLYRKEYPMVQTRATAPAVDENPLLTFPVMGGLILSANWNDIPFDNRVNGFRNRVKHGVGNETYTGAMNYVLDDVLKVAKDTSKETRAENFKTWREANTDTWQGIFQEAAQKWWNERVMTPGGITETDRPRTDPIEREYFTLLDKAIAEMFKGAKDADGKAFKVPTNDTDTVTFTDGESWSRAELRNAVAEQPGSDGFDGTRGDELRAQAIDIVEAKKLKSATPTAPIEAVKSASQFGLKKKAA